MQSRSMFSKSKYLFLFCLLCSIIPALAQSDSIFHIEGHVIDNRDQLPVENTLVFLETDLCDTCIAISDSNGYFQFNYIQPNFSWGKLRVNSSQQTHKKGEGCSCYLADHEIKTFSKPDGNTILAGNFTLERTYHCCDPPPIIFHFRKNESTPTPRYREGMTTGDSLHVLPMQIIHRIFVMLIENPTIIIELNGHCDPAEANKEQLSHVRVEYVKAELVKLGVEPDRIMIAAHADHRLLVKPDRVKLAKTKQEQEELRSQNRRISVRILSWDYGTNK